MGGMCRRQSRTFADVLDDHARGRTNRDGTAQGLDVIADQHDLNRVCQRIEGCQDLDGVGEAAHGLGFERNDCLFGTGAAVIDAGPLSGVVQTLTPGKATITAQYGGKKATAVVTVTAATVQELQITPSAPNLAPGSWTKFEAVAVMSDQTTQQVTNLASWASSAPAVLAIDDTPGGLGKGLAQAISAGTTVVSATWGGVTAKVSVEVKAATLVEMFAWG